MSYEQKRRPGRGGADLHVGDRHNPIKPQSERPPLDDLGRYQALSLISQYGVLPELATMLATLEFGGVQ